MALVPMIMGPISKNRWREHGTWEMGGWRPCAIFDMDEEDRAKTLTHTLTTGSDLHIRARAREAKRQAKHQVPH